MGFFSSLGSAISSGFSSICSAFSSGISSLGSAVSGFAARVLPTLSKVITNMPLLNTVATIATGLLQVLGILDKDENIEEKGKKVVYAKELGINMDDFPSFDEYLTKLDSLEVDETKIGKYTLGDRLIAGLAVCSTAMDNKLNLPEGSSGSLWILSAMNPEYFNKERLETMIGVTNDFQSIVDYFTDNTKPTESLAVEKNLVEIEHKLNGETDISTIYKQIDDIKSVTTKIE